MGAVLGASQDARAVPSPWRATDGDAHVAGSPARRASWRDGVSPNENALPLALGRLAAVVIAVRATAIFAARWLSWSRKSFGLVRMVAMAVRKTAARNSNSSTRDLRLTAGDVPGHGWRIANAAART
jgi:hypothetical protein